MSLGFLDINGESAPRLQVLFTRMQLSWSVLTTATRPTYPRVRLLALARVVVKKNAHEQSYGA